MKRIMIIGPTASGKTELAHRLALEAGGEIISADSRQCYRRIDIGTAKPDPVLLREVTYHNISNLDLQEQDSVSSFLERAETWRRHISKKEKRIIYAGGSTLHLEGLIRPLDDMPAANRQNLAQLQERADREGLRGLYELLEEVDPASAEKMDGINRHRILRALDVWMQTGRPFSSFHRHSAAIQPPDDLLVYGLRWTPRKALHMRIHQRVENMLQEGLVEETRQILADGYDPGLQALQTVGYREVIRHLAGEITVKQMSADIKTATRRYAKRQLTWFRRWSFVRWFDAESVTPEAMAARIQQDLAADTNKG